VNAQLVLEQLSQQESRRIFATLLRLLGDFDRAEEALQEAFRIALEKWPLQGVPKNPVSWLISAGRFRAIDQLRRQSRNQPFDMEIAVEDELEEFADDRLRLIFTCCHPSLAPETQVALTLREVVGLETAEIARAFLIPLATLAQRLVRAKSKIRDAKIAYELPERHQLPERLESVLKVIYLVYNAGYGRLDADLTGEAIYLGRLVHQLLPEPSVKGLLALMLLHQSRAQARSQQVPLDEQDRSLWDRSLIEEGKQLLPSALAQRPPSSYAIQAAISALHADSSWECTPWGEIVGLYDHLLRLEPSPVVQLNRAMALSHLHGPDLALQELPELPDYPLWHAARADLFLRLGQQGAAVDSYRRAISLTQDPQQARFWESKLASLAVGE
jgi:RNA polymerase sigma-70 factor (ECF subfamily)